VVSKAAARSSGVLADWAAAPAARRLRMPRVGRLAPCSRSFGKHALRTTRARGRVRRPFRCPSRAARRAPPDKRVRGDAYRLPELVFVEWVAGGPLNQIVDPHESDWITRPIQVDQVESVQGSQRVAGIVGWRGSMRPGGGYGWEP
jgi:hypothetical protein